MSKRVMVAAAAATMFIAGGASAQELRIGFMNTLNHPLGKEQKAGFDLGLASVGWKKNGDKIAGVPTKVVYCDDQFKPDVGLACARRFMEQDKVQIVAGITWSNILAVVQRQTRRNKVALISTNAGWSGMAGRRCSRYFISTSWNNDQTPEAMGQLMSEEGLKNVFLLSPNYQAGKDMLSGFKRFYKGGKVSGQILFKLGQKDFQAELTRIRATKPDALFVFAPGPMGIAFMKQWAASGLGKSIKLYTVFSVDYVSLKPIGKAAIGSFHTNYWNPEDKNPVNQKFIADYKAKVGRHPSHFAAQAYDAPRLIAAAVKARGGNVEALGLVKAMRKVKYASVRGAYKYNVNGIPIQNFYKRSVLEGPAGGATIRTTGVVFVDHKDAYWQKCPGKERH